jgi:Predicted membrane protein/domain
MNWYYVDQGKQAGPVDDAQLDQLLATGKIQQDTLIWREGMANWTPYNQARGTAGPAAAPAATAGSSTSAGQGSTSGAATVTCTHCGNVFPVENTIRYGAVHVCANCKPAFLQKLAEGAAFSTGQLNYAGFWIRFGAKMIDGIILGVPFMIVFVIVVASAAKNPGMETDSPFLPLLLQLGMIVLQGAYSIFFIGKYGATPGKMVCKLKVVKSDGSDVTYARATGRFFAEMLSGLICNIGYIIAAFDSEKRSLHDHMCNTRVIHK